MRGKVGSCYVSWQLKWWGCLFLNNDSAYAQIVNLYIARFDRVRVNLIVPRIYDVFLGFEFKTFCFIRDLSWILVPIRQLLLFICKRDYVLIVTAFCVGQGCLVNTTIYWSHECTRGKKCKMVLRISATCSKELDPGWVCPSKGSKPNTRKSVNQGAG